MDPEWLSLVRRLQAIAQNGLAFSRGNYDRLRYDELREVAVRLAALGSGGDVELIRSLFSADDGYRTPKVDVRGAVVEDGRVLLVQERSDRRWTLPGGWAEPHLSPSENVVKEVREESGLDVVAEKLVAVYDRARHESPPYPFAVYKLVIRCRRTGGALAPSDETMDARFFAPDDLPPLSEGRINHAQVARVFEHDRHPEWPTDFD